MYVTDFKNNVQVIDTNTNTVGTPIDSGTHISGIGYNPTVGINTNIRVTL